LIPCLKSAVQKEDRLQAALPCNSPASTLRACAGVAVKIDVFGNQNIFKDRKNSSWIVSTLQFALRIAPHRNLLQSIKSYFSPCGCQRADFSIRAEPTVIR
jgi:hypothetical protein